MTHLYARATPDVARILRIVEGAVKNTMDAHPELEISPRHRRSIAKRAAGTLAAQWPQVLAAHAPSERGAGKVGSPPRPRSSHPARAAAREALQLRERLPLDRLAEEVGARLEACRRRGLTERAGALREVLGLIDQERRP